MVLESQSESVLVAPVLASVALESVLAAQASVSEPQTRLESVLAAQALASELQTL